MSPEPGIYSGLFSCKKSESDRMPVVFYNPENRQNAVLSLNYRNFQILILTTNGLPFCTDSMHNSLILYAPCAPCTNGIKNKVARKYGLILDGYVTYKHKNVNESASWKHSRNSVSRPQNITRLSIQLTAL